MIWLLEISFYFFRILVNLFSLLRKFCIQILESKPYEVYSFAEHYPFCTISILKCKYYWKSDIVSHERLCVHSFIIALSSHEPEKTLGTHECTVVLSKNRPSTKKKSNQHLNSFQNQWISLQTDQHTRKWWYIFCFKGS